jgi:hypothetical protein
MTMATGKKKRSNVIEVDFEGVESGGGQRAVPDGVYSVKVAQAPTKEEGSESGEAYLSWKFAITKGKQKGATLYDNTSLQPQALWKLKSLLEAMGEEVPDSTLRLVPSEYVDRELNVEVVNEEYNGRDRPKVTAYIVETGEEDSEDDESEDSEDDEDDEKPARKKGKSKKSEDEDDESEDDESEDDESEDDEDEEDEKPKGKGKRALARAAKKKSKNDDDDDESEDDESEDDESEDEDDDKPAAKKKGGSSKVKKGVRVSFEDDGKTVKGKVLEVDGSVATVDVKGDEWQVQLEDLTVLP